MPDNRESKKSKKSPGWGGIIALCLCCSLIFGAGGAVLGSAYLSAASSPAVADSADPAGIPLLPVSSVTGAEYSLAELYVNSCASVVGVTVEGANVNIFGQLTPLAASGSGFIISEDGYIVTNCHVVERASSVKVTLYSGESYDASVIGTDSQTDVALLKINASGLKRAVIGNSEAIYTGQRVAAIGNPLGELTYTLTDGIVSAVDRDINIDGSSLNMLQTNTAINPGNSGGPLFDMYGKVIGITTAKYSSNMIEGIGFAIPINDAMSVIEDLRTNGYVKGRPMLGITGRDAPALDNRGGTGGVYVQTVDSGSCAEKAGIMPGDIITVLGDTKVSSLSELSEAKKSFKAGDTTTVTLTRGNETVTVNITFDEQKASA